MSHHSHDRIAFDVREGITVLTFRLGTRVTLQTSLDPFAESVNLEAVGEE